MSNLINEYSLKDLRETPHQKGSIFPFAVQNLFLISSYRDIHSFVRARSLYSSLPNKDELLRSAGFVDIPELFHRQYGIAVINYISVTFFMLSRFSNFRAEETSIPLEHSLLNSMAYLSICKYSS